MNVDNWRVKRDPSEVPAGDQKPNRSSQQRRNNGTDRNEPSEQRQGFGRSQQTGASHDTFRRPLDDRKADEAIDEGRRLYIGNLPYEATVKDIEALLNEVTDGVKAINMSVDPMTGRNPSYCFVDFKSKELAQKVIEDYNGRDFLRRPLKVKPGVKTGTGTGRYHVGPDNKTNMRENPTPYNRWRNMETPEQRLDAAQEGRRLYVGGLPRFEGQYETNVQVRQLFTSHGFEAENVSKMLVSLEAPKDQQGNYHYCFVDVASADVAGKAIAALNGLDKWDWKLKVSKAKGSAVGKPAERKRIYVGGLPEFDGPDALEKGIKELFEGFDDVKVVSKLHTPREERAGEEGNRHFCFVELADEEQTDIAIGLLDWKEVWGWKVRIKQANTGSQKPAARPPRGWGEGR